MLKLPTRLRLNVTLRLDPTDVASVRREAERRVLAGTADRVDLSRVVRDAIRRAPWSRVTEERGS